jgi:hypothetical protein
MSQVSTLPRRNNMVAAAILSEAKTEAGLPRRKLAALKSPS